MCGSGWLATGVVAALGADGHFAVAFWRGHRLSIAGSRLIFRRGWLVSNGVLGTNIVGHGAADGIDFVEGLGKERDAAVLSAMICKARLACFGCSSFSRMPMA